MSIKRKLEIMGFEESVVSELLNVYKKDLSEHFSEDEFIQIVRSMFLIIDSSGINRYG